MNFNFDTVDNPLAPYQQGQWDQFYNTFLQFVRKYKFVLYSFASITKMDLIPIDSPLEEAYKKMMPYGQTAFIDHKYRIRVFERFLVEKQLNAYEFTTLIIHEILHYALGHLEEFAQDARDKVNPYEADAQLKNIVYDALINSTIALNFNYDQRFTSLFEKMYEHDKVPECLLRPGGKLPNPFDQETYDALYSPESCSFYELRDLIERNSDPNGGDGQTIVLLGGHGAPNPYSSPMEIEGLPDEAFADGCGMDDSITKEQIEEAMKDVVEDITKEVENNAGGRGDQQQAGGGADPFATTVVTQILKDFIKDIDGDSFYKDLILVPNPATFEQVMEKSFFEVKSDKLTRSVWPTMYDRRQMTNRALGIYQPFFSSPMPDQRVHAVAYIDVSGSTTNYHKVFLSSIAYNIQDFDRIFVFSTVVREVSEDDLRAGRYYTTGGTNDCWAAHMLEENIEAAVVFTDGWFSGTSYKEMNPSIHRLMVVYTEGDYVRDEYFSKIEKEVGQDVIVKEWKVSPTGAFREV